jgi:putative ABC transport system substrate-binding protein
MDRRAFLGSLAGLIAAPLAAEAQQAAKVARIGYLASNLAASPHLHEAFRQGLHDVGYFESRNIVIEYRDAEGKLERLRALAAELVGLKVDVIVAGGGTPAALAAKQETRTLPIVFTAAADPVTDGLVPSLARPGSNVTGSDERSVPRLSWVPGSRPYCRSRARRPYRSPRFGNTRPPVASIDPSPAGT